MSNKKLVSNTLADAKTNPNFDDPVKRLEKVSLPSEVRSFLRLSPQDRISNSTPSPGQVNLSTPIQIQLRDQRSFGRHPLIGVCLIKDFRAYEVSVSLVRI